MKKSDIGVRRSNGANRRKKMKKEECYSAHVYRVLKQVYPNRSISHIAMAIMNSFVNDIFERCATEASRLTRTGSKRTMTAQEIKTAVRLLLPGDLGHHAEVEGNNALTKYNESSGRCAR